MNFLKTIRKIPDDRAVVIFPEEDITITGADLKKTGFRAAAALIKMKTDTIGIHMPNCPESVYMTAAAFVAGIKVHFFNALYEAEAEYPVYTRESAAVFLASVENEDISGLKGYDWKFDENLTIMSTSGTSGKKTVVEKSLKNHISSSSMLVFYRILFHLFRPRIYNCSPWYHTHGSSIVFWRFCGLNVTEITAAKYNPAKMRENINKTKPLLLIATSTMLSRCLMCGEGKMPWVVVCGGEMVTDETLTRLEECLGTELLMNGYGSTELGGVAEMMYECKGVKPFSKFIFHSLTGIFGWKTIFSAENLPGECVGCISRHVDVRIMKDGEILEDGQVGDICVKSKSMVSSLQDTYYNTGDVGYKKGNLLYYKSRSKYVINRSGEKIIPADIEKAIRGFDGVTDVVVVGIPSETHGEDICAVIESRDKAEIVTKEDLTKVLPRQIVPQYIFFTDELPLNASRKTDIGKVREFAIKTASETHVK